METIKDLYKRLLNRHPPPPLGGPTGMHRIRFQKERKKNPEIGFLRISLFSASLDLPRWLEASADCEENDY
jgi:hypothetical protein